MAWDIGGSIRVAEVADAAAIAAVHVEAWRETYVGIVPVQVLAGLSVDRHGLGLRVKGGSDPNCKKIDAVN